MSAVRVPWRTYLALFLTATLLGLLGQLALAGAVASQADAAWGDVRASDVEGVPPVSAPPLAGHVATCSEHTEPGYGLVDPCIPRRSPFDP
jgi:hypothetical protein